MWRLRSFELLSSGELVYSEPGGRELGRVALKGAAVTIPSSCCSSDREFAVRGEGQVLTLRATDINERDLWTRKLNAVAIVVTTLKYLTFSSHTYSSSTYLLTASQSFL